MITLLCLVCLLSSLGGRANGACKTSSPPEFGQTYYAKGTIWIPYAEVSEPFEGWFDGPNDRSRIDYYGGTVKTYQLGTSGQYGASIKLAPVTTEDQWNEVQCLQVNGTNQGKIGVQPVLPDLAYFQCSGTDTINGEKVEIWYKEQSQGEKKAQYWMWIKRQGNTVVPVKYEMRGYNTLLGSHFDHYYIDYESFNNGQPGADVFTIPSDLLPCDSFPGPGVDHVYTFNPMKEFVEGHEAHVDDSWELFKGEHGKGYSGVEEHSERKEVFRQNMRYIHSKNRANLGFGLAANHLADRTDAELRALRGRKYSGGYNGGMPFPYDTTSNRYSVPDQWNWRLWGAVTPVKDQSICGSCWSFATTGAVEGAYQVRYGTLYRLSQQALVDCSWGYGNNGCDGGEDYRAYQWIMKHGGLPTEDDYGGYLGQDGTCHFNDTDIELHAGILGFVNITTNDENAMKMALFLHGPVSVSIDASLKSFTFYSNGVYYDAECKNGPNELDHAVLAVGYGTLSTKDSNRKYWLIKNSWSNMWGNDGYILMEIRDNNCGVMTAPTYVTFDL